MNMVIKYMWQRYVTEVGYLTNFIPNISALNSKLHIIINKVAAGNFCKWASKLTLAVAWDLLGSRSAAAICTGLHFILVALLNPVWTQGKLQQSKLVRLSSSSSQLTVWLADTLLSAEASQSTVS